MSRFRNVLALLLLGLAAVAAGRAHAEDAVGEHGGSASGYRASR